MRAYVDREDGRYFLWDEALVSLFPYAICNRGNIPDALIFEYNALEVQWQKMQDKLKEIYENTGKYGIS